MKPNFDGKQLLELMLMGAMMKDGNPFTAEVLKIFAKHGIGVLDGMAILLEISMLCDSMTESKKEEEPDEST